MRFQAEYNRYGRCVRKATTAICLFIDYLVQEKLRKDQSKKPGTVKTELLQHETFVFSPRPFYLSFGAFVLYSFQSRKNMPKGGTIDKIQTSVSHSNRFLLTFQTGTFDLA